MTVTCPHRGPGDQAEGIGRGSGWRPRRGRNAGRRPVGLGRPSPRTPRPPATP